MFNDIILFITIILACWKCLDIGIYLGDFVNRFIFYCIKYSLNNENIYIKSKKKEKKKEIL